MFFESKWGSQGTGDGQFEGPEGIATAPLGDIYVADTANDRIQRFAPGGIFVGKWGRFGDIPGRFNRPVAVVVDSGGNVYVADYGNNRIQKFGPAGTFISSIGQQGSGPGQFSEPSGVAVDATGNLYVADTGNRRIQKFDSGGNFITAWGAPGQFSFPTGIALDFAGNVYVTDFGYHNVQKLDSNGASITTWGAPGSGTGSSTVRTGSPSILRGASTSPIRAATGFRSSPPRDRSCSRPVSSARRTASSGSPPAWPWTAPITSTSPTWATTAYRASSPPEAQSWRSRTRSRMIRRTSRSRRAAVSAQPPSSSTTTAMRTTALPTGVCWRPSQGPVTRSPRRSERVGPFSSTCSDGSNPSNIDVSEEEVVTCTFTNRKRGRIVVVQDSTPNDPQDFDFTAEGGSAPLHSSSTTTATPSIPCPTSRVFDDVVPGSGYSVSQSTPAGWGAAQTSCSNGSSVSNIDVAPGETVTCTFANLSDTAAPSSGQGRRPGRPTGLPVLRRGRDEPRPSFQLDDDGEQHNGLSNHAGASSSLRATAIPCRESVPAGGTSRRPPARTARRRRTSTWARRRQSRARS